MKKGLLVSLLIGLLCSNVQAQKQSESTKNLSDRDLGLYYLKQSKTQKTIGWVLLGSGLVMELIGSAQYNEDLFSEGSDGEALMLIGSLSTIASVPLFIMGAKNKGRAEILLRNQNIPLTHSSGSRLLSVGLAIPLGR